MKLSILLLLISLGSAYANNTYSQTKRLSLNMENTTVKKVLSNIETQSEFYFMYSEKIINANRKVSITARNQKLETILKKLFAGTDVGYAIKDRIIVLTTPEIADGISGFYGQQAPIHGVVRDPDGNAIPGVTVAVKGTSKGTITDLNGNYSIDNVPDGAVLIFSFVGMKTQEITVGSQTTINVTLEVEAIGLDEVVTIGYRTIKKRDVTGSITSISSEELSKAGTTNIAQAIQGKTAGVLITRTNGKPGAGVSVRIRGVGGINNSEPLYVIDGIYGGSFTSLNPEEIESIEILKDASSAAIYGARGANGVVLITTKRGKKGKMKITYNGSVGFQNMINVGDVSVLNAQEYGEVQNIMAANDGITEPFGDPARDPDLFPVPSQLGAGTDWMSTMYQKNALIQNHLVSFAGGNEKSTLYMSIAYLGQEGMMINNSYSKYNFRLNSDHNIFKWLKVGNATSFGHGKSIGGDGTDELFGNFSTMLQYAPTIPVFNTDGSLAGPPDGFYLRGRTPYADNISTDPLSTGFGVSNRLYAEFKPLEYLTFTTSYNFDYSSNDATSYYNGIYEEGIISGDRTSVYNGHSQSMGWTWTNLLKFNKRFGKHTLSALAGYEMIYSNWDNLSSSGKYYDPAYRVVLSALTIDPPGTRQSRGEESMVSYFASASYNYNDKYYFTGNVRRDGSSRFGANNKFGVFPSASVAWRLSNENFFPENNIVNDIKIRASYGEVGNDKIGNYRYIAGMGTVFYSFSGDYQSAETGLVTNELANADIKWERSIQQNIGLDLMMLNSKLHLTADYFKTDVDDMLLGKTVPAVAGVYPGAWGRYVSVLTNAGQITNSGLEFEVGYKNKVGELSYGIHANLTTYKNEVVDLGQDEYLSGETAYGEVNRTYVGGSMSDFYGFVCEGIFQNQAEIDAHATQEAGTVPGDFKYKDISGPDGVPDGIIDAEFDREVIGSPIPDFTYGFGFDLGYKNFNFTALFYGTKGNMVYNALRANLEQQGREMNKSATVLNAWHGEGTSNTIPVRRVGDQNNNIRTSTAYLEDGSFLRLQNIVLSYDIPVSFGNANIFVSGDNLLTFTKYTGFNPEISLHRYDNNLNAGADYGYYPSSSVFRLGINLTF